MVDFVGALELWKLIVGVLVFTVTSIAGGLMWVGKRIRAVSSDVAQEALAPHAATVGRVAGVERDLADVAEDIKVLKQDHGLIAKRMSRLETTIENVARREDLVTLSREFAEFRGTVVAENRQMSGMVDSMYKALLRADRDVKS